MSSQVFGAQGFGGLRVANHQKEGLGGGGGGVRFSLECRRLGLCWARVLRVFGGCWAS